MRESTRLLFTRARERARLARSLERQAAKLALNAQREYEHGQRLFLKACAELGAADEAEGSASAGRAHVPRSPAGGLGIASGVGSKESLRGSGPPPPSALLKQGTPGNPLSLKGGESEMASEAESAAEEPSAEEQAEEEAAEEPAEEGSAAEEAGEEPAAEE